MSNTSRTAPRRGRRDPAVATTLAQVRFEDLDRNGDGELDAEELAPIAHLLDGRDMDLDGNGSVSKHEFKAVQNGLRRPDRTVRDVERPQRERE